MRYLLPLLCPFIFSHAIGQKIDSVKSVDYMIYYQVNGVGKPIYLLTGGPGITPYGMHEVAMELSKDYQCVLVHQRGTGKTRIPVDEQSIRIEKYCQDIRAIKEKLGHRKITLFGHSWGGMLSMHYATLYSDDLDKLILVGPGGYNLNFNSYFGANIRSRLSEDDQKAVQILDKIFEQSVGKEGAEKIQSELLLGYLNIEIKGYFYDKGNVFSVTLTEKDFDPRILDLMMSSLEKANWDLRDKLEKIKIKALVLQGRQDPIDMETARGVNSAIKGSELVVIEQSGHFPWIERPTVFYKAVKDFLARN